METRRMRRVDAPCMKGKLAFLEVLYVTGNRLGWLLSLRIRGVGKRDIVLTVTNYLLREGKQKRSFVST